MSTRKHSQILCWVLLHIIPTGVLQCFRLTGQSRCVLITNRWYSLGLCRFYGGYSYVGVGGCSSGGCAGGCGMYGPGIQGMEVVAVVVGVVVVDSKILCSIINLWRLSKYESFTGVLRI
jgi:hypothetical protein